MHDGLARALVVVLLVLGPEPPDAVSPHAKPSVSELSNESVELRGIRVEC